MSDLDEVITTRVDAVEAYMGRQYLEALQKLLVVWRLQDNQADLLTAQLLLISMQRLGKATEAEIIGGEMLVRLGENPWGQLMIRVTLGQMAMQDALNQGDGDIQRCQALYYGGCRLETLGEKAAAREAYSACISTNHDSIERQLAASALSCGHV